MAANSNFIDVSNITYCGKEAQEIFAKDVYALDLRGYGITLMDNVKGKTKLYSGELGSVWQEYTCPFSPDGEVVLSEDYIEPVAIKVNLENCYDTFWNTYLVEQTSITLNGGVPATFGEWFFERLRVEMAKEYQEIFFKGNTDYDGATKTYLALTDGVQKILSEALDGTANLIEGSDFTVNNIIAQVEAAVMAGLASAATAEVSTDNYKILLNKDDVRLLMIALGKDCSCNLTNSEFKNYAIENGRIYVMGFEVVPTEQNRSTVIFGPAKNLVLGFDTLDSHVEYKFIDMRETTGDNMFRIIAISNIAVGVIYPALFTLSQPR